MLRNEIQKRTGLTRKAIEYYEEKRLLNPRKSENEYREYSEEELETLTKVALFRKLGLSTAEIKDCISSDGSPLSEFLRRKQNQLEMDEKRTEVIELIIRKEKQTRIDEKMALMETEESIYERLEQAFPGYFGQMFFAAYQPFLNEPSDEDGKDAFDKFVRYLDDLPPFTLTGTSRSII